MNEEAKQELGACTGQETPDLCHSAEIPVRPYDCWPKTIGFGHNCIVGHVEPSTVKIYAIVPVFSVPIDI